MEDETWLPVVGYDYEVSDFGRVRRVGSAKCRKPVARKDGREQMCLWRNNWETITYVHTLVAEAFLGPRPEGLHILHYDGDASNNFVENLRYGTASENMADAIRHGTFLRGPESTTAGLSWVDVDVIRAEPRVWGYQKRLAERFGVSHKTISNVIAGKRYNLAHRKAA